jgi:hypothetical protein
MNFVREGFAGAGARFHLVGLYTLAALLARFAETLGMEDPATFPLLLFAYVLFQIVLCGVFGILFLDASGRRDRPSFGHQAFGLLLPIVWLSLKVGVIILVLAGATTAAVAALEGWERGFWDVWKTVGFWGGPILGLAGQILTLYSLPLAIRARFDGRWRTSIRDGCRMFRVHPGASARIGMLLLAVTAFGGALQYARGPAGLEAEPDIPETLILLVNSYLLLASFFAAARVVLAPGTTTAGPLPERDAAAPGPPA